MAPKRDIRNYFKPAPPGEPNPAPPTGSKVSRVWPSPRIPLRTDHASSHTSQASPALDGMPSKDATTTVEMDPQTSPAACPPSTSQSSTNSNGSKRTMVNGEQVVQNSESDTDPEELQDLVFGFKKPPPRKDVPAGSRASDRSLGASSTTRTGTPLRKRDDDIRRPPSKPTRSKPSLAHLVQSAQRNAEKEVKMAERLADLEKPVEETPPPDIEINEQVLAGVVEDDEDGTGAQRLYLAMQRTDALSVNCVHHFFGQEPGLETHQVPSFPKNALPPQGWAANFEDTSKRDEAFLTGFAQQVFQFQDLPEELIAWMLGQVSVEQNDFLRTRYVQFLEAYPYRLGNLLTPAKLDDIFRRLGADIQCINALQQVIPSYEEPNAPKRPLPSTLNHVIWLLQSVASSLPAKSSSHAIYLLWHVCFDDSVMSDPSISQVVQDAIESIMCGIPIADFTTVLHELVPLMLKRLTHPILQSKFVRSLPTKSPLTASFQRHMALALFLHPTPFDVPLDSPRVPSLIHTHLQESPNFTFNKHTDYSALAARLTLLDIGIGPGPTTVPYQPLLSPTIQPDDLPVLPKTVSLSPEQVAFNQLVDALTQRVKLLGNNIVQVGAVSDLSRLEAKDCSDRLYHRLENAVRIGGRRKKGPFIDKDQEDTSTQKVLHKWLAKRPDKAHVVNVDVDSDGMQDGAKSDG